MTVHIVAACAGFLLAVLWVDLIFDTQILRRDRSGDTAGAARARWTRSLRTTAARRPRPDR